MIDQRQGRGNIFNGRKAAGLRALDHDDVKPELARGFNLGVGCRAARVFGHDHINAVFGQKRNFIIQPEWAGRENVTTVRNVKLRVDRVNAAHQIGMLRRAGKPRRFLPSDRQKNPAWSIAKRGHCTLNRIDGTPFVVRHPAPPWTLQLERLNASAQCSVIGMGGDLRSEWMGGVDQQDKAALSQESGQTFHASEAANSGRNGQRLWLGCTTGKRDQHINVGAAREPLAQKPRFGRSAKDQDTGLAHG